MGRRVVQISLDVVVDDSMDGEDVAKKVSEIIEKTTNKKYEVVGYSFVADPTSYYKEIGVIK